MSENQTRRFEGREVSKGKRKWTFELSGDRLVAIDVFGARQGFTRAAVPGHLEVPVLLFGESVLILKRPSRIVVQVPKEDHRAVVAWLGPPNHAMLQAEGGLSLAFCLPVGLLIMALSLNLLGAPPDSAQGASVDVVGVLIGTIFITAALLMKVRPSPWNFLVVTLLFAVLAGDSLVAMLQGRRSWYWLFFVAMCVVFGIQNFRKFARYRGVKRPGPAPADGAAPDAAPLEPVAPPVQTVTPPPPDAGGKDQAGPGA
jgi:hypothetical protein